MDNYRSDRLAGLAPLVLAPLLALPVNAQQAPRAAALVFDGVTVVDVENGTLILGRRVVITGNRIAAVGGGTAVAVPKGAQVVDAKGKYVIPGLWDMHVHPSAGPVDASARQPSKVPTFYPLFIANGITGIRDAWAATPLDTLIQWRGEILAGTRVGPPHQLLGGATFGQRFHYENNDSVVVGHIVDSLKAEGANFLKVYPYTHTVAAAARRAGLPFGGHVYGNVIGASDDGLVIVDHVNSSGGLDTLCLVRSASLERCQAVAERFRRNGTWWVPTLAILPGLLLTTDPGAQKPYLTKGKFLVDSILRKLSTKFWWIDTAFSGNWLRDGGAHEPEPGSPSDSPGYLHIAQRAGLPILAGTDAGKERVGILLPGIALHVELAIYVAEGLTPLEALQTATLNPAKMLHGTDSLGTIAPGKLADLVLLDADPLADITNTTTIRAVVANGRYFDRAAIDTIVKDVQARGP